jgi:hypothetical protein
MIFAPQSLTTNQKVLARRFLAPSKTDNCQINQKPAGEVPLGHAHHLHAQKIGALLMSVRYHFCTKRIEKSAGIF